MSLEETAATSTFIERLAISLYAFMKQAGLKVGFGKTDALTFVYNIADITEDGDGIAMSFSLDLPFLSSFNVEDTPEHIEKFCYGVTLDLGCQMFKQKCSRLLRTESKSKILLPGQ